VQATDFSEMSEIFSINIQHCECTWPTVCTPHLDMHMGAV